jgi:hypothetical protein
MQPPREIAAAAQNVAEISLTIHPYGLFARG